MPSVADHMTRNLLTVEPDTGLREAAKQMCDRGVGSTLVLEGGRLVGIVTERDVLKAFARGVDPSEPAATLMTRDPETISSSDTTEHAAVLMMHGGFRHLPVVDEGELVGILSIRNIVEVAVQHEAPRGV